MDTTQHPFLLGLCTCSADSLSFTSFHDSIRKGTNTHKSRCNMTSPLLSPINTIHITLPPPKRLPYIPHSHQLITYLHLVKKSRKKRISNSPFHNFASLCYRLPLLVFMGREGQGGEQAVRHSSIALLQERFRQLQRVKEMREERELLRVFPATESRRMMSPGTTCQEQQPKWFFHPELVQPSRSFQGPTKPGRFNQYSLGENAEFQGNDTSLSMSLWPDRASAMLTAMNYQDDKDVDTSLHL